VITRSAVRLFRSRVVGLARLNPDGTDRQAIAAACRTGDRLVLSCDTAPRFGRPVIRVCRPSGGQLGALPRDRLRRIAHRMRRGWRYAAVITDVAGSSARRPLPRIELAVFAGRAGVPDEVWEAALGAELALPRHLCQLWFGLAIGVAVTLLWLLVR
jgi:hypothetical protein